MVITLNFANKIFSSDNRPTSMKFISTIFFAFTLVAFASCNDNSYEAYINSTLADEIPNYNKYDSIFIIPRSGCTSCAAQADIIFKAGHRNKKNLYIFTSLYSEKDLRIELGRERIYSDNVFIDKDNKFWKQKFEESHYPTRFTKEGTDDYVFDYMF